MTSGVGPAAGPSARRALTHWVVPAERDPRWGQIATLTVLTIAGQLDLGFSVAPRQILTAVGTALLLEVGIGWWRRGELVVPASAAISGLSIGLLLRTPDTALFALAAAIAVLSKTVLTLEGRHVFNPSNLGLVVVLTVLPQRAHVIAGQWGSSMVLLLVLLCAGSLVGWSVHRFDVVVTFLVVHAAVEVLRHGPVALAAQWQTTFAASVVIFAFFMVTDPRTSPATRAGRVVYAAVVAVAGEALVVAGLSYGLFVALTLACAAVPALDAFIARKRGDTPAFRW